MERPTLTTRRLTLRPMLSCDAARIQQLAGDRRVAATTLNIPHPYPDGLAAEWISNHEDDFIRKSALVLAICLSETGKLIGAIGLTFRMEHQLADLGFWIGVDYWNQGYCSEASAEILRYGFTVLGLNKITASYFAGNEASGRVMQKSGMKAEAHLCRHIRHWGEFHDLFSYGILREEFLNF